MHNVDPRLSKARHSVQMLRINYTGRRPVADTLLGEFDAILDNAEAEMKEIIKAKEHDIALQYEGRIQQAEKRDDQARADAHELRKKIGELRSAMEAKRVLREARKRDDSDVQVTIDREWADHWDIADLEEIAYRLRAAGGTDDTVVSLSAREVTAKVPDPNVVTLGKREVERPHPATMVAEAGMPWRKRDTLFMAMLALGALVGILGLTVW